MKNYNMKKIVVLTYGDSSNPATWSNVPYLLVNSLRKKVNIKAYNIETKQNVFTYLFSAISIVLRRKSLYYFVRSKINYNIVTEKIKRIIEKEDNDTDMYLLLSYDYDITLYTKKKVVLLSDWSAEYIVHTWYNRDNYWIEKKYFERIKNTIKNAYEVISLVEDFKVYAEEKYKRSIKYYGMPINAFVDSNMGMNNIDNRKYITFIGKNSYKESAIKIIDAFNYFKLKSDYELHIIGMSRNDFNIEDDTKIYFHGYLDKGNENELEEYYNVLINSKMLINTNEKWAGMSSLMEALYYYVPLVISKNNEASKKFGDNNSFIFYSKNEQDDIIKEIRKICFLSKEEYRTVCFSAHSFVKGNTYDNYVDNIINIIDNN